MSKKDSRVFRLAKETKAMPRMSKHDALGSCCNFSRGNCSHKFDWMKWRLLCMVTKPSSVEDSSENHGEKDKKNQMWRSCSWLFLEVSKLIVAAKCASKWYSTVKSLALELLDALMMAQGFSLTGSSCGVYHKNTQGLLRVIQTWKMMESQNRSVIKRAKMSHAPYDVGSDAGFVLNVFCLYFLSQWISWDFEHLWTHSGRRSAQWKTDSVAKFNLIGRRRLDIMAPTNWYQF